MGEALDLEAAVVEGKAVRAPAQKPREDLLSQPVVLASAFYLIYIACIG